MTRSNLIAWRVPLTDSTSAERLRSQCACRECCALLLDELLVVLLGLVKVTSREDDGVLRDGRAHIFTHTLGDEALSLVV
eukprot:CAMPEP_0119430786 /NCGR_PEP_ID=MMETSP1335-20130426/44740_1 /TAXON_ID=259385 /ORGANISM="Chrysoculter rhomboideus, Strain RCC1486" /LENGTH=79 /DNA_ID=CAMNT_0007456551 /DNA_START=212 /DNA_END=448 /DNA_ORIENTATION=-